MRLRVLLVQLVVMVLAVKLLLVVRLVAVDLAIKSLLLVQLVVTAATTASGASDIIATSGGATSCNGDLQ